MQQDRKFKSLNIAGLLQLAGKPLFFVAVFSISFLYFIVVAIKQLFTQTNSALHSFKKKKPKKSSKQKHFSFHFIHSLYSTLVLFFTFLKKLFSFIIKTIFNLPSIIFQSIKKALHGLSAWISSLVPKRIKALSFPTVKINFFRLSIIVALILFGYYTYQNIFADLPHPKNLLTHQPPVTTKLFDRNQRPLYQIYKDEDRSIISLEQVPRHVILATLAIEDSDFYNHPGFSIKGIIRALKTNITKDQLQGGSTITQQLIKNTLLTPERTLIRKIKEVILAITVESYFTKDEILTMYLNHIPYGGTAYGIEAASQMYFNKSIQELTLAESALIAGLPAAPTSFSPYGANPEYAIHRQKEVLRRMVEEGYASQNQVDQALSQELVFASPTQNIAAPHFVMYVKDYLVNLYGEQHVSQGGLSVTTSIDLDIQELAENIVQQEFINLEKLNIRNAAVIITQPKTGEILAMVGSRDYFDTLNDGQVNVTLRPRQPGSSIKPVTYAYALEHGYTPNTIIDDSPVVYNSPGSRPYAPKNYDGRFHGRVTLRQALANSYNVPAVKTLNQFGVSNMVSLAQDLGISTWDDSSRFGLALTLGGGEVTLFDMAAVYGTFANMGINTPLNPLLSITDFTHQNYSIPNCPPSDSQLSLTQQAHAQTYTNNCQPSQVLSPSTSFLLTDILSDNKSRSLAFGTNSVLNVPGHQVAVKTGTTNNMRDNWTIGYTKDYVVGVWVGNNDNTPMSYVASGITGASPIWNKIVTALLKDQPTHQFTHPSNIVKATICPATNTLTCQGCPNPKTEYFIRGTEPKTPCSTANFKPKTPSDPNRDQILDGISTN